MDDTTEYGIGQFSTLTRLSVRMLRHYDEHGVLVPAFVDPVTGYRRYSAAQVDRARQVRTLRDVGFGVSSIAALLAVSDPTEYHAALHLRREELLAESRAVSHRLALLDHLITDKDDTMSNITITERIEPALTLATLRGTIPTYSDEGLLWQRLWPELATQQIAPTGPGGCIEYDDEYKESDVDEAVWVPVAPGTAVAAPLVGVEWPERRVAVATLVGPYTGITEANQRLGAYLAEHGLRMVDHGYNRYLTDPSKTPAEHNVTEICYPIG